MKQMVTQFADLLLAELYAVITHSYMEEVLLSVIVVYRL